MDDIMDDHMNLDEIFDELLPIHVKDSHFWCVTDGDRQCSAITIWNIYYIKVEYRLWDYISFCYIYRVKAGCTDRQTNEQ